MAQEDKVTCGGQGGSVPAITVRVFGSHRRILKQGHMDTVKYVPGETVAQLLQRLGVHEHEVWMVIVNGKTVSENYVLAPGDEVSIMSPVNGG